VFFKCQVSSGSPRFLCGKDTAISTPKFFNSKNLHKRLSTSGLSASSRIYHSISQILPTILPVSVNPVLLSILSSPPHLFYPPCTHITTAVRNSTGRHNVYDIRRLHRRWNRSLRSSNGHSRLRNGKDKVCIIIAKSHARTPTHIHIYTGFGLGGKKGCRRRKEE